MLVLTNLLPAFASEGFEAIVRIVKSGVDEKNLIDYVNSSPLSFPLTVDEILYLNDLGLSPVAIQAITSHGQNPDAAGTAEVAPSNISGAVPIQEQAGNAITGPDAQPQVPEATPAAADVVQEDVVVAPVITTPPADQAGYSLFYEGLAPYGNWLDLDGEWCWQPTAVIVDHSWSPYCQRGHWVYSDCGWAWESTYSWGWAPFHYGRWRHHTRYGWIWRPDRVWGPAWVSWRYSDSAIGWAPLPPEVTFDAGLGLCYGGRPVRSDFDCGLGWDAFTFVPIERFHESRLDRHRFERSRAESAFHAASMVASRVSSQNGRIVNFGPPPGHITAITHQEIHPVTLVDHSVQAGAPIPRSRTSGSTLAFYRPQVSATTHETPRQVVLRSQAREQVRRSSTRHDEVFTMQSTPTSVVVEQNRGRQSRSPQSVPVFKVMPAIQDNLPRVQSHPIIEDLTRQRQAEEAAARLQEEARRRADDLIRVKNMERLRTQEQQRQREIADQQSRAAAISRQQEEQRQAIRIQREAEETAARWQVQQARTVQQVAPVTPRVHEPYRALSETLPDYGNATLTGAASTRGAYSRSTNTGNSSPVSSKEGNKSWKR